MQEDLSLAANTVSSMGGGLAVVSNGELLASLALPVAGLVSKAPIEQIVHQLKAIKKAMDQVVSWRPLYRVFKACFGASLVCNAGPHLRDLGIVDTATRQILRSPLMDSND